VRLGLAEVLELTSKIHRREDQIEFLRRHNSEPLRGILKFTYDPDIEWLLPPGAPPYRPCEQMDQQGQLYRLMPKIYEMFIKGGSYANLRPSKREALFVSTLESIDPKDAELLCYAKDKCILTPHVTADLVAEAFPGLLGRFTPPKELEAVCEAPGVDRMTSATAYADRKLPEKRTSGVPIVLRHGSGATATIEDVAENLVQEIAENIRRSASPGVLVNEISENIVKPTIKLPGVCWLKDKQRWQALKVFQKKKYYLGVYKTLEDANAAIIKFNQEKGIS